MESVYFNNLKFTRKNEDCYYRNAKTGKRLHRYVWEYYNGPIPDGYEVHHIDGNKGNNDLSNLQLLSIEEHRRIHSDTLTDEQRQWRRDNLANNARPAASKWHKSDSGKEWHTEHVKLMHKNGAFTKTLICTNCGKKYTGCINKNGGNTFCSNACKSQYRRKCHIDDTQLIKCVVCGKEKYVSKRATTKTCSRSCTNTYRSWLKKGVFNEGKDCQENKQEG